MKAYKETLHTTIDKEIFDFLDIFKSETNINKSRVVNEILRTIIEKGVLNTKEDFENFLYKKPYFNNI